MILYHGSDKTIVTPIHNYNLSISDYGNGFYLTNNIDLAKEWACKNIDIKGYVNEYDLNIDCLKILDLTSKQYTPLHWITILIQNRKIANTSLILNKAKEYLIKNYSIDITKYDVIVGYRADDSYFAFVKAFLRNEIDINQLEEAITVGELGIQYFLSSKKAFENIKFIKTIDVDVNKYYRQRMLRENRGRKQYQNIINNKLPDKTILEIIKNDN